jgi:inorganic pyrophosphatase
MKDDKGPDEKILCVSTRDPRYGYRDSIERVNPHTLKEIIHFFEVYKALEDKEVEVGKWSGADHALRLIQEFRLDK